MKDSVKLSLSGNSWQRFLAWGLGFICLGLLALSFSAFTTLLSVVLLGGLILVGGIFVLIDAWQFWRHKNGFAFHLLSGIIYSLVGLMLIAHPVLGSVSLTLVLSVFFIVVGLLRILNAVILRFPRWTWNLASGVITLLLGLLILSEWPSSGLFIIGLFIGIDLLFLGWSYTMLALYFRKELPK